MSDDISRVKFSEDFNRESLQLNQHLEKMTEEMENISVKLSWMAYDMVVLRTSPDLSESIRSLEDEFLKCKAVICGPTVGQDQEFHPVAEDQNTTQQ
ncbi:synaptonemal complex central element protein 3 [Misgurnus anguillicaudatus]|uniref:synaptonemal complex central element protein 3 n=1 Tax=Misgurnus anguillicaudatus TaxID=75329 RepID=UPI003CCFDC31